MAKGKGGIISGIITLIIGGTAYTISQADIVSNFSKDTGLSETEAQQYVESITEDELVSWDELGNNYIEEGQYTLNVAYELDCVTYEYEWESSSLTCAEGKSQLLKIGNSEIELGEAYIILNSDSATTDDISIVIGLIDKLNANYSLPIVNLILDYSTITEMKNSNSYNKAVLQAALDSE